MLPYIKASAIKLGKLLNFIWDILTLLQKTLLEFGNNPINWDNQNILFFSSPSEKTNFFIYEVWVHKN